MTINKKQNQEIIDLLKEYGIFSQKIHVIQNQIEELDLKRKELITHLDSLHQRENNLYTEIAKENNITLEEVKTQIIKFI